MKSEIKKLFCNNEFIAIIILSLIACMIVGFCYYKVCDEKSISCDEWYSNSYFKYENIEQLEEIIKTYKYNLENVKSDYENGKIETKKYNARINEIKKNIAYCQYLCENDIPYGESIRNEVILSFDKFDFFRIISPFFLIFFLVSIMPLFCFFIVNYEFSSGVYRLVYIGQNRTKIILKKYLLYISTIFLLAIFMFGLLLIMSLPMETPFKIVLIYLNGNVFAYTVNQFVFYEILSAIIQIFLLSTLFFAIAIHQKKLFGLFLIVLSIMACLTIFSLLGGIVKLPFQQMTSADSLGYSIANWSIASLIVAIVIAGCFIFSVRLFKTKELK